MGNFDQRLADAILRNDFLAFFQRAFLELNPGRPFAPNWHHETMALWLSVTAITHELDRLVINLPPRAGKSTMVSVALPAFLLGLDPTKRIIVVAYNQDLSLFFARQTLQVMQAPWYRRIFPSTVLPARPSRDQFFTSAGGYRMSTSTGGTLTGRGGDIIIIDDPLKADDAYSEAARASSLEWATNTLFTRLDSKPDGAIILVQQRQHEDDLSGHMLATKQWAAVCLPAIAPSDERYILSREPLRFHDRKAGDLLEPTREPLHILDGLKREMGSDAFAAQYLQAPLPPDGGPVKVSWFRRFDEVPDEGEIILSVDTASKAGLRNDWSVIQSWRVVGERRHLEYVWRRKVEYPELREQLVSLARSVRPDTILIEDKGLGTGLIADLKAMSEGFPVIAYDPGHTDKESRMRVQSAKIESGLVFVPSEAPWLEEFFNEVRRFPNGRHDDQIDAMSQLLDFTSARRGGEFFQLPFYR